MKTDPFEFSKGHHGNGSRNKWAVGNAAFSETRCCDGWRKSLCSLYRIFMRQGLGNAELLLIVKIKKIGPSESCVDRIVS